MVSRELERECVVVFDEAHNIDNVCIEALSVNLRQQTLDKAGANIRRLEQVSPPVACCFALLACPARLSRWQPGNWLTIWLPPPQHTRLKQLPLPAATGGGEGQPSQCGQAAL
jgi:hypothetical protein